MKSTLSVMLSDVEANDADVENAEHLLTHHTCDDQSRCAACGQCFPCIPRRIAETMLRTAAMRS